VKIELHSKLIEIAIPSASGIVKYNNSLLVVGDNSPYLYCLDLNGNFISKHLIFEIATNKNDIIEKKHKPDFESMELVNEHELYIFGSGSKSPERDVLLIVYLKENYRTERVDLTSFYAEIRNLKEFKGVELNIEACSVYKECMIFFNRSNNLVLIFKLDDFKAMVFQNEPFMAPKIIQLKLPSVHGIEAGFSGATSILSNNQIVFTASVENTPNAYDDGEILGSFVGVICLNDELEVHSYSVEPITVHSEILKIKVESVCVHAIYNTTTELLLVTDSDGGKSELLTLSVNEN